MFETSRQRIMGQMERANAVIRSNKDSAATDKIRGKYKELCYQLMLLNEAESVRQKAVELVQKHDSQAYAACVHFFKNVSNTDGPGKHSQAFRDSIREQDKAHPELTNKLLPSFQNITPEIIADETLYEKVVDF